MGLGVHRVRMHTNDENIISKYKSLKEAHAELEQRYLDLIKRNDSLVDKAHKFDIIIKNFKLDEKTNQLITK